MTISYWQQAARASDETVDVAVVGGGLLGGATAYWIHAQAPSQRVAILESSTLASGASGRNAGFVLPIISTNYSADREHYGPARARKLLNVAQENRRLLDTELNGEAFSFRQSGGVLAAGSAEEADRLRQSVQPLRADGRPAAFLSAEAVNKRLVSKGFEGALYLPAAGMLDPLALVHHLVAQSEADVYEHHPVHQLRVEEDGRVVLETPHRRVRARQVVLALGAYLPQLYPALKRYVRPVRAQMLATEPASDQWFRVPAYTHEGFFYVRQLEDGTVLVGGARHLHEQEEVGYEDETTPALQADLERYLHRHFPQTRGLAVRQRWSGLMGFSPDRLPVVGRLPDEAPGYWVTGLTGHGLAFGLYLGRLLAKSVLEAGKTEEHPLFGAKRFATAVAS